MQIALNAQDDKIVIRGKVTDQYNNPVPMAHVSVIRRGMGTLTNHSGFFLLTVSKVYRNDTLLVSFLGYEPEKVKIGAITMDSLLIIQLKERTVELSEVIIRPQDAVKLIEQAINAIPVNYHNSPLTFKGFYRIGTKKDEDYIQLSEAVFDVFSYGYGVKKENQLRLLKMRSAKDEKASHGIDLGLKPKGLFEYDIVKRVGVSEIFSKSGLKKHQFELERIVDYHGAEAYEISFDQKNGLKESLYMGTLYLDVNTLAFLSISYTRSAKGMMYAKFGDTATRALMKILDIDINIRNERMEIKYAKYGAKYFLSSVNNDVALNFVSARSHYDFTGHTRVDYVVTEIDTTRMISFRDSETLGNNKVIEFQVADEDKEFWKEYNVILEDFDANAVVRVIEEKNNALHLKRQIEPMLRRFPKDKGARIDSILSFYHARDQFNGTALVKNKGDIILHKNYGYANIERHIPFQAHAQYRIGSLTKSFTALLIQQLVKAGAIKYSDSVGKFIPEYVHKDITVDQLLTHTSGIPNYTVNHSYLSEILVNEFNTKEIVLKFCSDSLEFKSGEKFRYSNSGYIILAAIIEIMTGKTYKKVLEERIFDPLKMNHAGFGECELNTAGYLYGELEPAYKIGNTAGAGGISAAASDLLKWDEALGSNQMISETDWNEMTTPRAEYADWEAFYGYGWMIDRFMFKASKHHKIVYHPGTDFGYYTMFVRQPRENSLIILLSNTGDFPRFDMTDLILNEIN